LAGTPVFSHRCTVEGATSRSSATSFGLFSKNSTSFTTSEAGTPGGSFPFSGNGQAAFGGFGFGFSFRGFGGFEGRSGNGQAAAGGTRAGGAGGAGGRTPFFGFFGFFGFSGNGQENVGGTRGGTGGTGGTGRAGHAGRAGRLPSPRSGNGQKNLEGSLTRAGRIGGAFGRGAFPRPGAGFFFPGAGAGAGAGAGGAAFTRLRRAEPPGSAFLRGPLTGGFAFAVFLRDERETVAGLERRATARRLPMMLPF